MNDKARRTRQSYRAEANNIEIQSGDQSGHTLRRANVGAAGLALAERLALDAGLPARACVFASGAGLLALRLDAGLPACAGGLFLFWSFTVSELITYSSASPWSAA